MSSMSFKLKITLVSHELGSDQPQLVDIIINIIKLLNISGGRFEGEYEGRVIKKFVSYGGWTHLNLFKKKKRKQLGEV